MIHKAHMTQSTSNAPGPDKFNFRILHMVWEWDSQRLITMDQHTRRLGYQPKRWKKAWGILLEKGEKRDLGLLKSYRVISLLFILFFIHVLCLCATLWVMIYKFT